MYVLDGECFSMNNVIVTEPAQYSIFIRYGSSKTFRTIIVEISRALIKS